MTEQKQTEQKQTEQKTEEQTEENKVLAQIKEMREKLREIRLKGSFSALYYMVRKGTITISKNEKLSEVEKKTKLIELCEKVIIEAKSKE